MAAIINNAIDYATAQYTPPEQVETGDHHIVLPIADGVLIAVVDGLGHGREAAVAAKRAITTIKEHHIHSADLTDLVHRCHAALQATRGAVMSLAKFDTRHATLTWLGIGNVEGRLIVMSPGHQEGHQKGARQKGKHTQQNLLLRSGVIGQRLPTLLASTSKVTQGDVLIFATDGIHTDFSWDLKTMASPREITQHIISRYCKMTDDALVLVIRYLG